MPTTISFWLLFRRGLYLGGKSFSFGRILSRRYHKRAVHVLSFFLLCLHKSLLALEFIEPRDDDGRVKAVREVRVDKGQADGSRPVDQKGPGHR